MQIISHGVAETLSIGRRIAKNLKAADIVCLFGQLGAGKTVLTKGIALGLGIKKNAIVSPSFVLIREYDQVKPPLYHFDLYRLKKPQDLLSLGYEEYLYDDAVSVIEWADRLKFLLPKEFLKIDLSIKTESQRLLRLEAFGRRYRELLKNIDENNRY